MRSSAGTSIFLALGLLAAGMMAVLRVGGATADAVGLLAVAVGIVAFGRAAFRLAEGAGPTPTREPRDGPVR